MMELDLFNSLKTTLEIYAASEEAISSSENIGTFLEFESFNCKIISNVMDFLFFLAQKAQDTCYLFWSQMLDYGCLTGVLQFLGSRVCPTW